MTKKTSLGYELELVTGPDGKNVWVATDPAVPGPYGMGATEDQAVETLVRGIEFWNQDDGTKTETVSLSSGSATYEGVSGTRIWFAGDGWRA